MAGPPHHNAAAGSGSLHAKQQQQQPSSISSAKRASGLRGSPAEEGAGPPSSRSFATEAPSEPASTSASGLGAAPESLTGSSEDGSEVVTVERLMKTLAEKDRRLDSLEEQFAILSKVLVPLAVNAKAAGTGSDSEKSSWRDTSSSGGLGGLLELSAGGQATALLEHIAAAAAAAANIRGQGAAAMARTGGHLPLSHREHSPGAPTTTPAEGDDQEGIAAAASAWRQGLKDIEVASEITSPGVLDEEGNIAFPRRGWAGASKDAPTGPGGDCLFNWRGIENQEKALWIQQQWQQHWQLQQDQRAGSAPSSAAAVAGRAAGAGSNSPCVARRRSAECPPTTKPPRSGRPTGGSHGQAMGSPDVTASLNRLSSHHGSPKRRGSHTCRAAKRSSTDTDGRQSTGEMGDWRRLSPCSRRSISSSARTPMSCVIVNTLTTMHGDSTDEEEMYLHDLDQESLPEEPSLIRPRSPLTGASASAPALMPLPRDECGALSAKHFAAVAPSSSWMPPQLSGREGGQASGGLLHHQSSSVIIAPKSPSPMRRYASPSPESFRQPPSIRRAPQVAVASHGTLPQVPVTSPPMLQTARSWSVQHLGMANQPPQRRTIGSTAACTAAAAPQHVPRAPMPTSVASPRAVSPMAVLSPGDTSARFSFAPAAPSRHLQLRSCSPPMRHTMPNSSRDNTSPKATAAGAPLTLRGTCSTQSLTSLQPATGNSGGAGGSAPLQGANAASPAAASTVAAAPQAPVMGAWTARGGAAPSRNNNLAHMSPVRGASVMRLGPTSPVLGVVASPQRLRPMP